jgi:SNF2 family DNA or RNA helicase
MRPLRQRDDAANNNHSPHLFSTPPSRMDQSARLPASGDIVRVRTRIFVVEDVLPSASGGPLVRMACLDDDAQGEPLEVVWDLELDTRILSAEAWNTLGEKGFDDARLFGSYLHTLRWHCTTATDPRLFQAPFRAGIRVDAYQLEPLRKALLLPRVNLFIADDVGLGKTIEAGLIASELMLRRRVRDVVVAAPPSMLYQWKDELEQRFGLTFEILDRAYIESVRREHGYGVNPWTTFPRFIVSHRLLIDEAYAAPMRAWLDNLRPGSLLILDEAHHAAPASGSRYAIDSRFTRSIRDIAGRFEHRLFLSATPHNGHSNSFSALLEILDPHRFTRGVPVLKKRLSDVMVRRLKEDIREIDGGFPKRNVVQIDLDGLPATTPELQLSRLLQDYREARDARYASAKRREQVQASLLMSGLQQRLLSSIEAFARTLQVHRRTMERIWAGEAAASAVDPESALKLLVDSPDADDDRASLSDAELESDEAGLIESATLGTIGDARAALVARERELLDAMQGLADASRSAPDARVRWLVRWMAEHMCEGICQPGETSAKAGAPWTPLRIIIFTEYEDSRRYLVDMLRLAIDGTDAAEHRIEVFHGPTPADRREAIKRAFNLPPDEHPVRVLVATDAAREGLNLQAHCAHLFHLDIPWNPARLEQRNGRIDRKLQPSPDIWCHYFFYRDRCEDLVLQAVVRKTDVIRRELGSLTPVISDRLAKAMREGIRHGDAGRLAADIGAAGPDPDSMATIEEELEASRERRDALSSQLDTLRNRIDDARRWIGLDAEDLRDALSCSLEMLGAAPLHPVDTPAGAPQRWHFPNLDRQHGADPTWAVTLDTLRKPADDGQRSIAWRRAAVARPITFEPPEGIDDDAVQLHLSQRVVQRLLGRFLSQGFVHHDLSRACLAHSGDAIPRIVLLGRLALYGAGAVRLHEEILTVTARWVDPERREGPLAPYARDAEARTLELLERSLREQRHSQPSERVRERLVASLETDIKELLPHLETRGTSARADADARLGERGRVEAKALADILEDQRRRVAEALGKPIQMTLGFDNATPDERRQAESNRRYWERWLADVEGDIAREPARIEAFYAVASARIEPVGLAYLWPVTG